MKETPKIYIHEIAEEMRNLYGALLPMLHSSVSVRNYIREFSLRTEQAAQIKHRSFVVLVRNHLPEFLRMNAQEIFEVSDTIDPLELSARAHGFEKFEDISETANLKWNLQKLIDDLLFADYEVFASRLEQNISLLNTPTAFGHGATLCHYVGSNGVEMYRQVAPYDLVKRLTLLIEKGVNLTVAHNIYGGGCSLQDLIETSAHPREAGLIDELVATIKHGGLKS